MLNTPGLDLYCSHVRERKKEKKLQSVTTKNNLTNCIENQKQGRNSMVYWTHFIVFLLLFFHFHIIVTSSSSVFVFIFVCLLSSPCATPPPLSFHIFLFTVTLFSLSLFFRTPPHHHHHLLTPPPLPTSVASTLCLRPQRL